MGIDAVPCRACGAGGLHQVLVRGELTVVLCEDCGLVQLPVHPGEGTVIGTPACHPGIRARSEHVTQAVRTADAADLLRGDAVRQFGGTHGGSWLPLLMQLGFTPVYAGTADVVVDCFGAMHDRDQRAAIAQLAAATAPEGVLLMQFESVADMVRKAHWELLSHNHFAYYTLTALSAMLAAVQMSVVAAYPLEVHGGTTMVAAVHARGWPATAEVKRKLADEHQLKIASPAGVRDLLRAAER
ncbi:hypothetical protein [[Mycobacterium] burgundiense]|uniref:Transferase n=1 Tax=[Mycobacterium] burgundiense TaxID=3064286 RepID=A0ABM9M268_9MYCO|nr:hypothetical protein [Mycolicibacterium sp. MU0053]CAJ1508890.1 hypothetical protein MU0053_004001 [Mycolicibacterium sp. MU0053]